MNQVLMTRLFKSIEGNIDAPLIRVAYSIVEDEKRKGHAKLANRLNNILQGNLAKSNNLKPTLKVTREKD